MPENSTRLGLPYILPSQAQKNVTHNEALQVVDAVVQLCVLAFDVETPPSPPQPGDCFALGDFPTGDWSGQAGKLAIREETGWRFVAPGEGWRAWGKAEGELRVRAGGAWQPAVNLDNLSALGVGTSPDTDNPLAVSGPATLLTHDGAGHRLKLNKAASAETASLLFQNDWTGHAEIGLCGDDDLHVKVSSDGGTWTDAVVVDRLSGTLSGAAIQSDSYDNTSGKLLKMRPDRGPFDLGSKRTMTHTGNLNDTMDQGVTRFLAWNTGTTNVPWNYGLGLQIMGFDTTGNQLAFRRGASPAMAFRATLDANLNFSEWMELYHTGNAVGTVSANPGIGSALFESGSNANGKYTRLTDGTQICTQTLEASSISSAEGSIFKSSGITWTYPASFASAPVTHGGNAQSLAWVTGTTPGTGSCQFYALCGTPKAAPMSFGVMAIGRWK